MAPYTLLEQTEEDAVHKSRLLNVEERPFKRITKRLLGPNALVLNPLSLPPTAPPDSTAADEEAAAHQQARQRQLEERQQWREDVLLDFAAFESSIIRIQFLLTSNIKERERYATEKVKIQHAALAVRDNTGDLRVQLEDAQRRIALRKEYDELAENITGNRLLKPRDEQQHNIEKLHTEIAELERESQDYAHTWSERRDQFGKIIDEGMHLRRLIRDEKEEVERREGMEGQEDADGEHKGGSSGISTPRPDIGGGATPMHGVEKEGEVETPSGLTIERGEARGSSPLREMQLVDDNDHKVDEAQKNDEEMAEDGELTGEPENTVAGSVSGVVDGGDDPDTRNGATAATEKMDIT